MLTLLRCLALASAVAVVTAVGLPAAPAQDKGKAKKGEPAGGTVEVYKDKAGEFRFRIKGSDGKVIANSPKGYDKKDDAVKALDTLKDILNKTKMTEVKDDKGK